MLTQAELLKSSQDLYRYERICEEHSAILRTDAAGCFKAYQEYAARVLNPMGFVPPRDEFDLYIDHSEKVLLIECKNALDHVHVVHAGFFLCRLLMRKMSEHGERVYLEFIRHKRQLDKQYPYIFQSEYPANLDALLRPKYPANVDTPSEPTPPEPVPSEPAPSEPALPEYPITLPARAFQSKEAMILPRVSLKEAEVIQYQSHPELLERETFASFDEDEANQEVLFRIPAFITAGQEKIFYVVYADEGPEAVAYSSDDLFNLLRRSERVLTS